MPPMKVGVPMWNRSSKWDGSGTPAGASVKKQIDFFFKKQTKLAHAFCLLSLHFPSWDFDVILWMRPPSCDYEGQACVKNIWVERRFLNTFRPAIQSSSELPSNDESKHPVLFVTIFHLIVIPSNAVIFIMKIYNVNNFI